MKCASILYLSMGQTEQDICTNSVSFFLWGDGVRGRGGGVCQTPSDLTYHISTILFLVTTNL